MALDGQKQHHLRLMLHSLNVRPFETASTLDRLATQAYEGLPAIATKFEGAITEAQEFPDDAYGATLGLVYFRYLEVQHRDAWEKRIAKIMDDGRKTQELCFTGEREYRLQSPRPTTPAELNWQHNAIVALQTTSRLAAREIDFFRTLLTKKRSIFSRNSDEAVNDPERILAAPWCLTDSEFAHVWLYLKDHPVTTFRLPPEPAADRLDPTEAAKVARDEAAKAYSTELLKMGLETLAKFLNVAVPSMLLGVGAGVLVGIAFEGAKYAAGQRAARRLWSEYQEEHKRREWLGPPSKGVGWTDYRDNERPRGPQSSDRTPLR